MSNFRIKSGMCKVFLKRSYFPYDCQDDTCSSKSNGNNNTFEYKSVSICRCLNLVKNQWNIL